MLQTWLNLLECGFVSLALIHDSILSLFHSLSDHLKLFNFHNKSFNLKVRWPSDFPNKFSSGLIHKLHAGSYWNLLQISANTLNDVYWESKVKIFLQKYNMLLFLSDIFFHHTEAFGDIHIGLLLIQMPSYNMMQRVVWYWQRHYDCMRSCFSSLDQVFHIQSTAIHFCCKLAHNVTE